MKRRTESNGDLRQEFNEEEQRLYLIMSNLTSRDILLQILSRTDVKAAMNLTLATAADSSFKTLHSLMQTEAVWKYWFERDLWWQIKNTEAFEKYGDDGYFTPNWIVRLGRKGRGNFWDTAENYSTIFKNKPVWKLLYMWYALAVSAAQYVHFEKNKSRFYPSDTDAKYLGLNKILISRPNSDPTEESFDSFLRKSQSQFQDFMYKVLYENNIQYRKFDFFEKIFPSFYFKGHIKSNRRSLDENFFDLFRMFFSSSTSALDKHYYFSNLLLEFPYAFPKSSQRPVIACSMCDNVKPKFMCSGSKRYYCNKKCQKEHYESLRLKD